LQGSGFMPDEHSQGSSEPAKSGSAPDSGPKKTAYDPSTNTIVNHSQGEPKAPDAAADSRQSESLQPTLHETADDIAAANSSTAAAAQELKGEFGRYQIERELGRGAMGTVYLAHDKQLDRDVALKVPQFSGDDQSDQIARFYREARAMATVHHPGLCPVYDVGEINGVHYLTMAYIEGKPLDEFAKMGKPFPGLQVAALIRKLSLALDEAHKRGIVHRDLKPANIMIDKRNEPIIMDFGLAHRRAKNEVQLTQTGSIMGTPAYMSPEQVDGDTDRIGPRSDIYSLGVICYQMLAGKMPFSGSIGTLMVQIMSKAPPPLKEMPGVKVDAKLESICMKALAKPQEDRQASAGDLASELREYIKQPIPPSKPTATKSKKAAPKQPPRRKKPAAKPNESVTDQLAADLFADIESEVPQNILPPRRRKSKGKRGRRKSNKQPPLWMWIAGAAACAVVLGIIIMITNGDGKTTTVDVPPGSDVKIDNDGNVTVKLPKTQASSTTQRTNSQAVGRNYALQFDGKTTIKPSKTLLYDGSHPLTMECRISFEGEYSKDLLHPITLLGPGGIIALQLQRKGGLVTYAIIGPNAASASTYAEQALEKNRAVHVAVVYDGNTLALFVDGKLQRKRVPAVIRANYTPQPLMFGALQHGDPQDSKAFRLTMDEVRFSKVARYTKTFTPALRFETDKDTLALYHFDSGKGDDLKDSSGNEHHGTIAGAKWVNADGSAIASQPNYALQFDGETTITTWGNGATIGTA